MTNMQTLLEGSGELQTVQATSARLASKWEKSGLLEGFGKEVDKNNMAMILENQAKQLVSEVNSNQINTTPRATQGGGANWAGVALPLVRYVFGNIVAQDFLSVQPMNLPSGLVFFLDFQYGTTKGGVTAGDSLYGVLGNDRSGKTKIDAADGSGLYGAGRFGYTSNFSTSSIATGAQTITVPNAATDLYNDSRFAVASFTKLSVQTGSLTDFDPEAVRSFTIAGANVTVGSELSAFTKLSGANLDFIVPSASLSGAYVVHYSKQLGDSDRRDFEAKGTKVPDASIEIPEINVNMRSEAIVAKTRKLKAVWTPEFSQDLNAYQNLDAEAELTSIMGDYIAMEIDLELLDMLIESAPTTKYWSAQNNKEISDTGAITVATGTQGFYNTQGAWFQTLGTKVNALSNEIHRKTLRGGANFMVISPKVSTIIESIPGFASTFNGDVASKEYAFGVQKMGSVNGRIKVYKNPYMSENTILMGYKGSQFLETGAVFAPYVPLIMTPLVYDPDTFTPRKGLLTRYAKKMVRPEFYGKIYVNGLENF